MNVKSLSRFNRKRSPAIAFSALLLALMTVGLVGAQQVSPSRDDDRRGERREDVNTAREQNIEPVEQRVLERERAREARREADRVRIQRFIEERRSQAQAQRRQELRRPRTLRQGTIGAYVQDVNADIAWYLDYDRRYGVVLREVLPDSPADEAGLERGDIITRVNDYKIYNGSQLSALVMRSPMNTELEVDYYRDGDMASTTVKVTEVDWSQKIPERGDRPTTATPEQGDTDVLATGPGPERSMYYYDSERFGYGRTPEDIRNPSGDWPQRGVVAQAPRYYVRDPQLPQTERIYDLHRETYETEATLNDYFPMDQYADFIDDLYYVDPLTGDVIRVETPGFAGYPPALVGGVGDVDDVDGEIQPTEFQTGEIGTPATPMIEDDDDF